MFKESQNSAKSSKVYWGKRTIEKKANMKVRFNCMIMKKQSYYAILMLLASTMLAGCSSSDEEYNGNEVALIHNFDCEEQYTTSEENGLSITRDESGRVRYIVVFRPDQDGVEKLLNAPTSFDDIRYLFPLSEGNEIKIEDEGDANIRSRISFFRCERS